MPAVAEGSRLLSDAAAGSVEAAELRGWARWSKRPIAAAAAAAAYCGGGGGGGGGGSSGL